MSENKLHSLEKIGYTKNVPEGSDLDKDSEGSDEAVPPESYLALITQIVRKAESDKTTLNNVHKIFKKWTMKFASAKLGVPLHPGAEKYYKEIGVR